MVTDDGRDTLQVRRTLFMLSMLAMLVSGKRISGADILTSTGANLHTSAVSQAVAYCLLKHCQYIHPSLSFAQGTSGGMPGFLRHSASVADFYAARRNTFEAIAHKYLDGLASWVSPVAGMFLWLDLSPAGIEDTFELIRHEALTKGVLAVPGYA